MMSPQRVKRILLTGMSGVGKSTVAERLADLGYEVIEMEHGTDTVVDEEGHRHWTSIASRELLATDDADVLFIVGSDDGRSTSTRTSTTSSDRVVEEIVWLMERPPA